MNAGITRGAVPLLLIAAAAAACAQPSAAPDRVFWTPYAQLGWAEIGHYDMQIHVHPGLGAEQYAPHETIDRYHAEGFKILAFTPHDYDVPDDHIESLYPWTRLAEIYETIKDVVNPTEDDQTYAEFAGGPYENRDPVPWGWCPWMGARFPGRIT